MKKLHIRFILYCTVGLFVFLLYFIFMFSFLNNLFYPDHLMLLSYEQIDGANLLLFLFCFATGGLLFSLLIVWPLSRIIRAIHELSRADYDASSRGFMKDGKVKRSYFLYQEVVSNLAILGESLKRAEAEQEELAQEKNEWIAGVSHDLKTPLSYITGYASLLLNKDYHFSPEERTLYVNEIYQKGNYIETLINELNVSFFLDGADESSLRFSQVELVSYLRQILADAANDPRAAMYTFDYQSDLKRSDSVIDEQLMYRGVYNLLMNCIEHNPPGTTIRVALQPVTGGIRLQISDDGVGMAQSTATRIFDKYFSSGKDKPGKGLGLFIAKQIIEAHKGKISVVSEVGKGTTFEVFLIAKEEKAACLKEDSSYA